MSVEATQAREFVVVIGLEVHVQLETATKIFCGCSTDFADADPNTHTCPVCLGLPGALPVVNDGAITAALKLATAIDASVPDQTRFHRKNYFYPDLPKNFQITQYDQPLCRDGRIEITVEDERKEIRIQRAHLEEDPGSLEHEGGDIARATYTLVDYNRAGVPLMEIDTAPDFRGPAETRAFLAKLEEMLTYLDIFDPGRDGSLRVDANVSLVPADAVDDPDDIANDLLDSVARTEVKNISSHKGAERALAYEVTRQRNLRRRGARVEQETRHWDETRGVTVGLRTKETESDYRYFPEYDLPPLRVADRVSAIEIPELPDARRDRFIREYGMNEEAARKLTTSRAVADFFEAMADTYDPNVAATWVADNLLGELNYRDMTIEDVADRLDEFERLIELVEDGSITVKNAEEIVLRSMLDDGDDPDRIIAREGLGRTDEETVRDAVTAAIEEHPDAVADYQSGEAGAINFLVGQVMQKTAGQADPATVNTFLREELEAI